MFSCCTVRRFLVSSLALWGLVSCSLVLDLDASNPTVDSNGGGAGEGPGGGAAGDTNASSASGGAGAGGSGAAGGVGGSTPKGAGGSAASGGTSGTGGAGGSAASGGTSGTGGVSAAGGATSSGGTSSGGSAGSGPECGDGKREAPEECDEGQDNDDHGSCTSECKEAICGDGLVWEGEEACDTAGASAACDADCTLPACGDGELNEAAGEICDDGVDNGSRNSCETNCQFVCQGQCPLRVSLDAPSGGDGRSWAGAMSSLQAAIDMQWQANGGQVWVKTGTFVPPSSNVPVVQLARGVAVYGGFAGDEDSLAERPSSGRTTLDKLGQTGSAVIGASNSRLDGFLVTGGNADADMSLPEIDGGGMLNEGLTNVMVANVDFEGNQAWGCGGGMANSGSEVQLEHVTFTDNKAERGGGMCNLDASVVEMLDVRFEGNEITPFPANTTADLLGGGLFNVDSDVTFRGGLFKGHPSFVDFDTNSLSDGTALWNSGGESLFFDVRFDSNDAAFGAAVVNEMGSPEFVNASFTRNSTGTGNQGALVDLDAASVVNCTFADNPGPNGINLVGTAQTTVENSVLWVEDNTFTNVSGPVTVSSSCVIFTGGLGGQPRPFPDSLDPDADGVPKYLLNQTDMNPCLDAGDNAVSDAAGLDWTALTTSPNSCRDSGLVDAGRHYQPAIADAEPCQ